MLMPALLPEKLKYCENIESQQALFELLVKHPPDLILFLESACSDETWAENHSLFLNQAIKWVHDQFFQDSLMMQFAKRLAHVFRQHLSVTKLHLPLNITIELKDKSLPISTLLYGSSSEFLKDLIRSECRDKHSSQIQLREVSYNTFIAIDDYISNGNAETIDLKDQQTVEAVLKIAFDWNLLDLIEKGQRSLKKWVSPRTAFETLIRAHHKGWTLLRKTCIEYLNSLHLDFCLVDKDHENLAFEFLRFTENSLSYFHQLQPFLTTLIFSGKTTADPQFSELMKHCSHLKCLDLSYSETFTDYLKNIPSTLQELILASCVWLNNESLLFLIKTCPHLEKLVVASDVNLNFEAWGGLQKLPTLQILDVSRCSQIQNEDIKLIIKSCEALHTLSLEECHGISDEGFYHISIFNSQFINLNFSRTNISDQPLIELANHCLHLNYLDLTRCEKITEKGLLEIVRLASTLRELNITSCNIPEFTIGLLKNLKPFLKIKY
jgi:F-box and leucine-rich repeat protein 2/20